MNTIIANFPIGQLPNRYGIKTQAMYNRLKNLGIKPTKSGKRAFISEEELSRMDLLNEHLKTGGTMGEFLRIENKLREEFPISESIAIEEINPINELNKLVNTLIEIESKKVTFSEIEIALKGLEQLAIASEKQWLLSSNQVKLLIGISPPSKKSFTRGSFKFTSSGKIGRQKAWEIEKI